MSDLNHKHTTHLAAEDSNPIAKQYTDGIVVDDEGASHHINKLDKGKEAVRPMLGPAPGTDTPTVPTAGPIVTGRMGEAGPSGLNSYPAVGASAQHSGPILAEAIPAPGGRLNPGVSNPTAPGTSAPVRNRWSSHDTFYVLTPDSDDIADGADKEVPAGTKFPEWWACESIILRGLAQAFLKEFPGSALDWRLLTQAFLNATTAPGGRALRRSRMELRQEWKEMYPLAAALHKEGRYDEIVLWDDDGESKREGKKGKRKAALVGGGPMKKRHAANTADAAAAAADATNAPLAAGDEEEEKEKGAAAAQAQGHEGEDEGEAEGEGEGEGEAEGEGEGEQGKLKGQGEEVGGEVAENVE